ncbi:MAG: nucleotide exchange factor GrpE [Acidimicrobiia bacterium]
MTHTPHTPDPSSPNAGEEEVEVVVPPETEPPAVGPALEDAEAESLGLRLPEDPHEANQILMRELVEARQESGELLENLQRLAAEFDNFRKRVERDQSENVQRASQRVIESILPTLDSLDAAMALDVSSEAEQKMLLGLQSTEALLLEALGTEGFAPIAAADEPFDPAVHEAVSVIPGEGDQVVQEELRKGYTMRGRVIRPALVIVGHA